MLEFFNCFRVHATATKGPVFLLVVGGLVQIAVNFAALFAIFFVITLAIRLAWGA